MRNYIKIGDKVEMKDGSILTVKALEFREIVPEEPVGYQKKRDIVRIIEDEDSTQTKEYAVVYWCTDATSTWRMEMTERERFEEWYGGPVDTAIGEERWRTWQAARQMKDIQLDKPVDGQLVLAKDPKNYNGIGDLYVIGRWSDNENCLIHHSGWKYAFKFWQPLPAPPEDT